ncbi:HlyD family type I secretion periplasmic adaptor subunit [Duganella sp. FT3S]|uniref:Membrane fusion protein (MFP) family protein n=1 Tax=Rugamonas fusca TaxID=2758568 RepID=A0A7W2I9I8_9BURK|nr:HlyD family type I secretion periplasmic adaptor subunit [Rugamonas fusca]MBA5608601.1 HlyD family type I secretion periplasmic adaptor subunit [Rugamonas fusca]
MKNLLKDKAEATEVIAHDVTPLTVNTDERAYSKLGWLIVLLGVGGFLLWAIFAPLDKGVPVSGTVAKESNRKAVQYQPGGTVDEILVKDGDVVKAGQTLVRMNDVQPKAQYEVVRAQYLTARAAEARLQAEHAGKSTITFPADLLAARNEPQLASAMALQSQLIASRQMAIRSELASFDENVAGLKSQLSGLEQSRDSKKEQLKFLKEQLDNLRDLAKDGYVPRSRLLDGERSYAQLVGSIAEDIGTIGRTQRQIAEVGQRRNQRAQEYQKEVETQLADVQRDREINESKLAAQKYELGNVEVKAPADGVVVGLNVFTKGGVIPAGFRMMDLVPTDDPMIVEAQVAVNLIDKVRVGLPAELIFSAFNTNSTPHIPGVVTQVSADRTVDERTGNPYYKIRAKVTPAGLKLIATHKLDIQPGMPVELFVKTGERSMMSYLLKPVFDRAKTSLTEE